MKAMILAAGLGARMRPLTDSVPKPLLPIAGSTLIELHLIKLAASGIKEVVINISYLAEKIEQHLGCGSQYGLEIHYSKESEPLETAGGIKHALSLLGGNPFLLINGDVWSDFDLNLLINQPDLLNDKLAHLMLVENPDYYLEGDFSIDQKGVVLSEKTQKTFTFSGISLLSPAMFNSNQFNSAEFGKELCSNRLGDVLKALTKKQLVSAQVYDGSWIDVGTPERLALLREKLG
jgi:MurNAc alpha-1-phosphate uridylyltransferase